MIAREEKLLPIKKDNVTPSMSRRRNYEQIVVELNRLGSVNYLLDADTSRTVITVHDAFAAESPVEQLVIRHVVFVGEKHPVHAAHCFYPLEQLAREPR